MPRHQNNIISLVKELNSNYYKLYLETFLSTRLAFLCYYSKFFILNNDVTL